jgi:hypothetical protein
MKLLDRNLLSVQIRLLLIWLAYDTVWKDGLIHKLLYNVIPCGKMVSLLEDMLSNRQFRVFVEDKSSKFRFLNNGLPQGSVLSPILFNLYTSDLPPINSRKFIYADDLAMAYQHQNFENVENGLSDDLIPLNKCFTKWRLCPNPQKTDVCSFHLVSSQKNRKLKVVFNETIIKHNYSPNISRSNSGFISNLQTTHRKVTTETENKKQHYT